MSKKDKIIKDLKNNPNNVRFETLKILLESEGYECFNKGGSHYQFRKKECDLITTPYKGYICQNGFKSYNRRMNYERLRLLS